MCKYNVVTVREMFAGSNRKSVLPLFTKLLCQNIMLPLPNEGDEGVEREKVEEKKGKKHFFIFIEHTPEHVCVLLRRG